MKRALFATFALFLIVAFSGACEKSHSRWGDSVTDRLVDYDEIEVVNFNVAGEIKCQSCVDGDTPYEFFRVEIYPKEDPTKDLAVIMVDDLGPFSITDLRYPSGVKLTVLCYLYTSTDLDEIGYRDETEITVPPDDGDTVEALFNFQH